MTKYSVCCDKTCYKRASCKHYHADAEAAMKTTKNVKIVFSPSLKSSGSEECDQFQPRAKK